MDFKFTLVKIWLKTKMKNQKVKYQTPTPWNRERANREKIRTGKPVEERCKIEWKD